MKKQLMKSIFEGVSIACILFCLIGVIFDLIYGGTFTLTSYSFTKMVIGTMIVGLGFSLPTLIYENEKYSLLVQTLIHMSIGTIVMIIVGLYVGWIPLTHGLPTALCIILLEIATALMIWFIYYLQNKKLAKKMNERIKEIQTKK
ncbi:DUF3021 domain-containing protein [Sharpea azabuensis]|uniref:DUF3021 domain-containing protein n=1 Tax=Sharpea azabuensis TaxID=322505 RepID=UPI0013D96150|nr:DUF3021 domain-containing protein [Sharpea azabuensis]